MYLKYYVRDAVDARSRGPLGSVGLLCFWLGPGFLVPAAGGRAALLVARTAGAQGGSGPGASAVEDGLRRGWAAKAQRWQRC